MDKAKIEIVENFIVVVCFALGRVDEGNIELWRREVFNTKIWEGSCGPRETISNTSQEWMSHPSKFNQPVYNPMHWAFKFPPNPTNSHLLRPNAFPTAFVNGTGSEHYLVSLSGIARQPISQSPLQYEHCV